MATKKDLDPALPHVYFSEQQEHSLVADLVRRIGEFSKQPFQQKTVSDPSVEDSIKRLTHSDTLPIVSADGSVAAGEMAVVYYAAQKAHLLPSDPTQLVNSLVIMELVKDVSGLMTQLAIADAEAREQIITEKLSKLLSVMEAYSRGSTDGLSDSMTVADLAVATLLNHLTTATNIDGEPIFSPSDLRNLYPQMTNICQTTNEIMAPRGLCAACN